MDRRCIICGLEPGEQCVYPRNMTEAKRWQNLAKLGNFDVDTESLCKHCCVCTSHLGTDQEYGSHPASTPDAVCSRRRAGGKISHSPAMKWLCLEKDFCQPDAPPNCCPYPTTNNKPNGGMQVKSKQNRDSMLQENSNVNGCNIGLHRCRAAQIQGNLYSQMRNNCYPQQSTGPTIGTAPDQNLKPSQPTVPVLCACINYPIPRDSNSVSEEASCPLMRNPSPAPASCNCKCNRQRSPKSTQNHTQQRPRSCDRLPTCACNRQQFQSSSDFNSSLSSSTGPSSSPTSDSHQEMMPDVKDKCTCKCSRQRSPKNTPNYSQQRPRSCDRLPTCACNRQQFQSSSDFNSSLSSSTGQSNSTTSDRHQEMMPDVKDKCTCKCIRQRSPKNTPNYSQQRPRSCDRLPSLACNKQQFQSSVSDDRNIKASQPTVPVLCACINYPIPRDPNAVSEKSWSPLMQSPSPAPAPCNCKCSRQRSSKTTQTHSQQRPKCCDRLSCFAYNKQKFQSSDDFTSSLSSSTGPSSSTTSESHQEMKPEVKDESCQTSINCQLKDQEVQCSQHSLKPQPPNDSSAAVTADTSTQPKEILLTAKCDCDKSASLATKYGMVSSKSISYTANIEMPNFEYAGEEQQYSVNAINVLLMNGSRQKPYEGPNPEICVLASDLADCNERAVFPEVDKPTYRLCRAATSGPNTKGEQDEANVLVLEEDPMNGCSPEDLNSHQGQSQSEQQFMEGINSNQNQCNCLGQIDDNWINSSCSSNYTKLLELQRSRINELENLLQQHNKLQQTIQARMTDLRCQEI